MSSVSQWSNLGGVDLTTVGKGRAWLRFVVGVIKSTWKWPGLNITIYSELSCYPVVKINPFRRGITIAKKPTLWESWAGASEWSKNFAFEFIFLFSVYYSVLANQQHDSKNKTPAFTTGSQSQFAQEKTCFFTFISFPSSDLITMERDTWCFYSCLWRLVAWILY